MTRPSLMLLCAATLWSSTTRAQEPDLPAEASVETDQVVAQVQLPVLDPGAWLPGVITLERAIERALAESPRLKAARAAMMASKGAQLQAAALPNPELGVEAENVGGQGPYRGFDSAEVTFGVSQLVEVGGKRSARQDAASSEYEIARLDYESARLDAIRDVTVAYAEAVAAQETVALASKAKELASDVLKNVASRVDAAAEPLFQRSKAQVALATSEMALDRAQRDAAASRKRLAALWGAKHEELQVAWPGFFEICQPEQQAANPRIDNNPTLARWKAELTRSRASLALEEANAIPDPSFSFGVRDFRETGDQAFIGGISIPIPVFNVNRGNIAKARHELSKTESDRLAAEVALEADLAFAQQEYENACLRARSLQETVIPAAEEAYALSSQGYVAGRFPYLEVLDAQRTLVEARAQHVGALKDYHSHRAEVERLSANHLATTMKKDTTE